jgi:hypothetical protein
MTAIALRQFSNRAFQLYQDRDRLSEVIDHYSGKDTLPRLESLSLLKDAIWRRAEEEKRQKLSQPAPRVKPPDATSVYALMGFYQHRILPDRNESEMVALARLSMENDVDRFAERMIAMLPSTIKDSACWYSADDKFQANLWDIEPDVQVAGITKSESLVLDGCRAAVIRWKGFPKVKSISKPGWKRLGAMCLASIGTTLVIVGIALIGSSFGSKNADSETDVQSRQSNDNSALKFAGIPLILVGVFINCVAPWLIQYALSGRVMSVEPWLIGVEGFLSAADAETHVYGTKPFSNVPPKLVESPSGTEYALPDPRIKSKRVGIRVSSPVENDGPSRIDKKFTLVDTGSNTVYRFRARHPPTVCVFVGREGGLGRYILCSEQCHNMELHKETVLRMPTDISHMMKPCEWLAIGHLLD